MLDLVFPQDKLLRQVFMLWFVLAVIALACSGLYSFLPYALRTPALSEWLNLKHLFNVSLMVHVNLGVLVWFLSITAMLMTIVTKPSFHVISSIAFFIAMIGTGFIIFSPFIGEGEPVKSDYVPILHNFTFILGISLFLTSILLQTTLTLLSYGEVKGNIVNFHIYISGVIFLIAVICFFQSTIQLNQVIKKTALNIQEYYEMLFWGAGHALQFNYVQLIIIVWLLVTNKLCSKFSVNKSFFYVIQLINLVLILPCVFIYWFYPVDSIELNQFFTLHMKHAGGIVLAIVAFWSIYRLYLNRKQIFISIELVSFFASLFLFLSGGIIGYLISGANVTVPAHYHGVILGITVSLMGLFYMLMPKLSFNEVNRKLAIWQIMLYTIGQFIHIVALAISGGYGVLRKAPGTELSMKAKMFMGAMGIGGSIALIGGILFVVLIFKGILNAKESNAS